MTNTERDESFRRFMCRHLVVLGVMFHRLKDGFPVGEEQVASFSCFVLNFGNNWALATAGHGISDQIIGPVRDSAVRVNKFILADYFGPNPRVKQPTYFECGDAPLVHIDNPQLGLDVGMIYLSEFYAKSLEANGVAPVGRNNWEGAEKVTFELYAMIGVPLQFNERVESDDGKRIGLMVSPVLVWIERLDQPPPDIEVSSPDWFIGKIDVAFDIRGMSGGPIFGFRRDDQGRWFYNIVAVQSRWYPGSQIILGTPLPKFIRELEDELKEREERARTTIANGET